MFDPPLPVGYYGNVVAFLAAISTARDLSDKPLGYALELVMKAKYDVTKGYIRSVADLMAIKGWLHLTDVRAYAVSDLTRTGFNAVDFGWGKGVYGGAARGGVGILPGLTSFYVLYTNSKGESGIVVPICLPRGVMDRFVKEVNSVLARGKKDDQALLENKSLAPSKL
ncbi:hypothetical protein SSX86_012619 [Deinandra increscens subsp. villosa]|uniref:Benzyl alcohol O-benzoyltransferase n=1 Tax=Deinandra increscens subsp. villosa TaxID=3103831 RepID=A0AAP0H3G0_9ASTR